MKHMKKALGLFVATALLFGLLAGCQSEPVYDPVQEVLGHSKDTVYFTFDGQKITAEGYLFWLAQYVDYVDSMFLYMGHTGIDWTEEVLEGVSASEYCKSQTLETVKTSWVIEQLAAAEGFSYTDEDRAAYEADLVDVIEATGGQEAYDRYLNSMLLTDAGMARANRTSILYSKMEEAFFAEGGRFEISRDAVRDYMEEQGILHAKHILLLTADPNIDGDAYEPEEIAAQRTLAEEILTSLEESADPIALFDELMHEYSEDTGLDYNPDGYLFSTEPDGINFTSRMVEEFEAGTMALGYNEISGIVESDYGFHIILRLDPTENEEIYDTYRGEWQSARMDLLIQERLDEVEVKTTTAFDELDVQDFYEKLTAYRDELDAAAEEAAKPEDETEGDGSGEDDGEDDEA